MTFKILTIFLVCMFFFTSPSTVHFVQMPLHVQAFFFCFLLYFSILLLFLFICLSPSRGISSFILFLFYALNSITFLFIFLAILQIWSAQLHFNFSMLYHTALAYYYKDRGNQKYYLKYKRFCFEKTPRTMDSCSKIIQYFLFFKQKKRPLLSNFFTVANEFCHLPFVNLYILILRTLMLILQVKPLSSSLLFSVEHNTYYDCRTTNFFLFLLGK